MTRRHHSGGAVQRRTEIVIPPQFRFAGRDAHPHQQPQRQLRVDCRRDGVASSGERGAHPVTGVFEQPTAVAVDRGSQTWVANAERIEPGSAPNDALSPRYP
jgi:hypothetical protein